MSVVVEEFKPLVKNSLRGFARVRFPSGMIMREIGIHTSHGKCWASPPSRPRLNRAGVQFVNNDGKRVWDQLIDFTDKGTRDRWSAMVVQAVHDAYPEALADAVPELAA